MVVLNMLKHKFNFVINIIFDVLSTLSFLLNNSIEVLNNFFIGYQYFDYDFELP